MQRHYGCHIKQRRMGDLYLHLNMCGGRRITNETLAKTVGPMLLGMGDQNANHVCFANIWIIDRPITLTSYKLVITTVYQCVNYVIFL